MYKKEYIIHYALWIIVAIVACVAVYAILSLSAKHDDKVMASYDDCMVSFVRYSLPLEEHLKNCR